VSAKHPKRTELAKFICMEIMDDDWRLGKQLCLGYADAILAMLAAPDLLAAALAQEALMSTPGDPTENIQRVIKMRRAALAKATEGRS
jgi:hypothetical protein